MPVSTRYNAPSMSSAPAKTKPASKSAVSPARNKPKPIPRYHVILLDDDDHSYDYVIEMLGKVFGHNALTGMVMAQEVDSTGRVIVETTTFERAEFKRDQVHAYGADWRIDRCKGSMSATIEPAE